MSRLLGLMRGKISHDKEEYEDEHDGGTDKSNTEYDNIIQATEKGSNNHRATTRLSESNR